MFKCRLGTHVFGRIISNNFRFYSSKVPPIRNIGIIAHIDAGKTTTTERMLYYSGLTSHIGDVDQGDTVMDYLPAERSRGITINSAAITFQWNKHRINLIDTPGHADFTFEVIRSIRVLDGAVTILDAVAGVEAQTEKVWKQAREMGIPRLVFVNKMDREGAGFGRTVREIVSKLETRVGIINIPYFEEKGSDRNFIGVIDIIDKKLIKWTSDTDGKAVEIVPLTDLSEDLQNETVQARTALIETLSEIDDIIVEQFLDSTGDYMEFSSKFINESLRRCTLSQSIVPVLAGASFRNIGVQPLLEAIVNYLPSPQDMPQAKAIANLRKNGKNEQQDIDLTKETNISCALAFKVSNDPIRGLLVYVRVYSGTLRKGTTVYNTSNGKKERIQSLALMQADRMVDINMVEAGNIAVIIGSRDIRTGDTLVAHATRKDGVSILKEKHLGLKLNSIDVPPPVFFATVEPNSIGDEQGMQDALDILLKEDPSLKKSFDEENRQTLLAGMGELHLEIAHERLKQLKAKISMGKIMVSYSETITKATSLVEKEASWTGATGDLSKAKVSVSVHPGLYEEPTASIIELPDDNIVEIPKSIPEHELVSQQSIMEAIEVGATPAFARGGRIARLPLRLIHVKIHSVELSVDSTTAVAISSAIRMAADEALNQLQEPDYVIMEPVMKVSIVADEEDVGNVVNDVSGKRRGMIRSLGQDDEESENNDGVDYGKLSEKTFVPNDYTMYLSKHAQRITRQQSIIHADIPLRSMIGYLTGLRSLTQGRGTFVMNFDRYEIVPNDVSQEILTSL